MIEYQTPTQVIANTKLALEEGVAGVFLINHDFDYPEMLPILRQLRGQFPSAFLGVNFHTMNGNEAFPVLGRLAREGVKIDAYWADNACIEHRGEQVPFRTTPHAGAMACLVRSTRSRTCFALLCMEHVRTRRCASSCMLGVASCARVRLEQFLRHSSFIIIPASPLRCPDACVRVQRTLTVSFFVCFCAGAGKLAAEAILLARQKSAWDGLYFGGTAFKNPKQHQKLCAPVPTDCLEHVSEAAARFMDVVTTSCSNTGEASDEEKIRLMRAGCRQTPLCIASGISADNVSMFFDSVDIVLAASSIQVSLLYPG